MKSMPKVISCILAILSVIAFLGSLCFGLGGPRPFDGNISPAGTIDKGVFTISGQLDEMQKWELDMAVDKLERDVKRLVFARKAEIRSSDMMLIALLLLATAYLLLFSSGKASSTG